LKFQANHVAVILDHQPVYRMTFPYATNIQLYPPEDEHLKMRHVEKNNIL